MTAYFLWDPTVGAQGRRACELLSVHGDLGDFFHLLAFHFGHSLLKRAFSAGWVKGIDYLYLAGSFYGIYRLVLGLVGKEATLYDLSLPLLLGVALALRFTKTSVEIFKWDVAPAERR